MTHHRDDAPETWVRFVRHWYGPDIIAFHRDHGRPEQVPWDGPTGLIQDVFERPEPDAPVMVLLHGIQGYGRMLLPVTRALWRLGVTMVVPDLPGNGLSSTRATRGRIPMLDQLAGAEAAVRAAAARWPGRRLIVGGASLGAPFAFILGLRVPEVHTLTLWNLFSPDDPEVLAGTGRLGRVTGPMLRLTRPFAHRFPGMPMSALAAMALERVNPARGFLLSMLQDPLVARTSSLGVMQSLQDDIPPLLRWEDWTGPILVLQPGADRMIRPSVTERTFGKLTGTACKRLEILPDQPHLPATVAPFEDAAARIVRFLAETESA